MASKMIRAFGLIVLHRTWAAGERYVEDVTPQLPCTTYCVKGRSLSKRRADGSSVPDFAEGYFLGKGDYEAGLFDLEVVEDNETFCYDSRLNGGYHPDISRLEVAAGTEIDLPVGAKWLLCRGTAVIDGAEITGPLQIAVRSADKKLHAISKCFILVFP